MSKPKRTLVICVSIAVLTVGFLTVYTLTSNNYYLKAEEICHQHDCIPACPQTGCPDLWWHSNKVEPGECDWPFWDWLCCESNISISKRTDPYSGYTWCRLTCLCDGGPEGPLECANYYW